MIAAIAHFGDGSFATPSARADNASKDCANGGAQSLVTTGGGIKFTVPGRRVTLASDARDKANTAGALIASDVVDGKPALRASRVVG